MSVLFAPFEEHPPGVVIRLYHGTDFASAVDIRDNGVDEARAALFNGNGEFWATTNPGTADVMAQVNPSAKQPARLEFDFPVAVLQELLSLLPLQVFLIGGEDLQFLPPAFPLLNRYMANRRVISPVPE